MLSNAHGMRELGKPVIEALESGLLERMEVGCHFAGLRIVPFPKFGNQSQQPCQSIRTFEAGTAGSTEIRSFLREIVDGEALMKRFASGRDEGSVGKSPD